MSRKKVKAVNKEIEALANKIADLKRQRAKLSKEKPTYFRLRCIKLFYSTTSIPYNFIGFRIIQ